MIRTFSWMKKLSTFWQHLRKNQPKSNKNNKLLTSLKKVLIRLVKSISQWVRKPLASSLLFLILVTSTLCISILWPIILICSLNLSWNQINLPISPFVWKTWEITSYIPCILISVDHCLRRINYCFHYSCVPDWLISKAKSPKNNWGFCWQVVLPSMTTFQISLKILIGFLQKVGEKCIGCLSLKSFNHSWKVSQNKPTFGRNYMIQANHKTTSILIPSRTTTLHLKGC